MAPTHSQIVPIAFWLAFVALGLFTSLGAPHKPKVPAKAAHHALTTLATAGDEAEKTVAEETARH